MKLLFNFCLLYLSITIQVESQSNNCSEAGDPLILTPLIKNGSYIEAQEQCKVNPPIGNITSYSGFFTVNERCNSNIHFWFFPSLNANWKNAPLVLWLQGGPGSTSLFGCFEEIGPFQIVDDKLKLREYTWNNETNLLFIDQPVGTGFSYTSNITGQGCYPENLTTSTNDLYQAVYQFCLLFPHFVENNNSFYITGESYAGKWIPSLALKILENNKNASIKINITALIIGGAYFHPIFQCIYSKYLYNIGLYDYAARQIAEGYEEDLVSYIQDEDWTNAAIVCGAQLTGIYNGFAGYNMSVYNYMYEKDPEEKYRNFVQSCEIRKLLHVGNKEFQTGDDLYIKTIFNNDTVQSVKYMVEALLQINMSIIFFTGHLDLICAYPMLVNVLNNLTWSGQNDYLNATRIKWCINEDQAGFYKRAGVLHELLVLSAGHYVPRDQPMWAYKLFQSIVTGAPGDPFHLLQPCNQTNAT